MEIKTPDLQQVSVNARKSPSDRPQEPAEDAVKQPSAPSTDRLTISDDAQRTASTQTGNGVEERPRIDTPDQARVVLEQLTRQFQQNPAAALETNSANLISRERVATLVSTEPRLTNDAELESSRKQSNNLNAQVSRNPGEALGAQANVSGEQVAELLTANG